LNESAVIIGIAAQSRQLKYFMRTSKKQKWSMRFAIVPIYAIGYRYISNQDFSKGGA